MSKFNNRHTYIYEFKPELRRALYWNGGGWSDGRKRAKLYTSAEAEPIVRKMMLDHVHAKTGDIRTIR